MSRQSGSTSGHPLIKATAHGRRRERQRTTSIVAAGCIRGIQHRPRPSDRTGREAAEPEIADTPENTGENADNLCQYHLWKIV